MKRLPSACLALALAGILPVLPVHAQDPLPPPDSAPQRDTVFVYERVEQSPYRSPMDALSLDALTQRRDHFGRMQQNGFGMLIGGIALAACGVTLMAIGINENSEAVEEWERKQYGSYYYDDEPTDGIGKIFSGYLITVISPALIIPGIILNRVGNGRRLRYQEAIDSRQGQEQGQGLRFDAGPNSLRLSYGF